MRIIARVVAALGLLVSVAGAQGPLETKTIELKHLKPKEAINLLQPYVKDKSGTVTGVGDDIALVTLRDTPDNVTRMEKVLAKYDHSPASVRLVFQLIEADTGPKVTSAANFQSAGVGADLDSTLRSVLRFPTYRLLAQGVAAAGEFAYLSQQLPVKDSEWVYQLIANVGTIRDAAPAVGDGNASVAMVHLSVTLHREAADLIRTLPAREMSNSVTGETVMSTGLDVPIGHTVVIGTAATRSHGVALILTVKPELLSNGR